MNVEKLASEKLDFFGDEKQGFGASLEGATSSELNLCACKFCDGFEQRIVNTHTPYYTIECKCGVELSPSHIADDGMSYNDHDDIEYNESSKEECKAAHIKAIGRIVDKWQNLTA